MKHTLTFKHDGATLTKTTGREAARFAWIEKGGSGEWFIRSIHSSRKLAEKAPADLHSFLVNRGREGYFGYGIEYAIVEAA